MPDGYQDPLSDWFLEEVKRYLDDQIQKGYLTKEEAQRLWEILYDELYPSIPETPEEMQIYYRMKTGKAVPTKPGATKGSVEADWDAVIAEMAKDPNLQPRQIFDTALYREYDSWRYKNLSLSEQKASEEQEYQAAAVAGGESIAQYYARQVQKGNMTREEAEGRLMNLAMEMSIAEGQELNRRYYRDLETERQNYLAKVRYENQLSQQAMIDEQLRATDERLMANLLPYPSEEEMGEIFTSSVEGLMSPAMQRYARGAESEKMARFLAGGGQKAMEDWWLAINAGTIDEFERQKQDILAGRSSLGYTSAAARDIGQMLQGKTGQEYLDMWSTLTPEQQGAYQQSVGYAGSYQGAWVEALERKRRYEEAKKAKEAGSPWEQFVKSQDWYTEFWKQPREYRPGGYAQRRLAPPIRSF
jgi:polyhydroxyalkanoate synthesis regulator phasin